MDPFGTVASVLNMVDVCRKILQKFKDCVNMPKDFMEHQVKFSLCCARFTRLCPKVENILRDEFTEPAIRQCISLSIYYIAKELNQLQSGSERYWDPEDPYGIGMKCKHAKDKVRRLWHENVDQLHGGSGGHGIFRHSPRGEQTGFIAKALVHPAANGALIVPGAAQAATQMSDIRRALGLGEKIYGELLRALEAPGGYWNRISWVFQDAKKFTKTLHGLGDVLNGLESVVAPGRADVHIDPRFEHMRETFQREQARDTFHVVEETSDSEAGDYHDIDGTHSPVGIVIEGGQTYAGSGESQLGDRPINQKNYVVLPRQKITRAFRLA